MQRGYILITTLVLLGLLALLAVSHFERSATATRVSAQERDAGAALQLAENALELVYGRFLRGADLDGDGRPDNRQRGDLGLQPPRTPAPYIYYRPPAPGAEQTAASLLQAVAEGEARAGGEGPGAEAVGLRVRDLYTGTQAPLHFVADERGLPVPAPAPWEALGEAPRAAVWMEIQPLPDGRHRLLIQSAARVGQARRYLQRLIGFYDNRLGRDLAALTEASPGPIAAPGTHP